MTNGSIETTISGGRIQGVAGAGTVHIENFTIYNRAVEEPAAADAALIPIAPCPYPGLAYFGPGDADLFFGRDTAIARLAEAVGRQSLTALVGASGSGKSSVVLAGLAPRLHSAVQPLPYRHRAGQQPVSRAGAVPGAALRGQPIRHRSPAEHQAVGGKI